MSERGVTVPLDDAVLACQALELCWFRHESFLDFTQDELFDTWQRFREATTGIPAKRSATPRRAKEAR